MAVQSSSPIASRARRCMKNFDDMCKVLGQPPVDKQGASSAFTLYDQRDRFKIWAGNMGALQDAQFTTSLDYRLREASRIVILITELLEDLDEALEEVGVLISRHGSSALYEMPHANYHSEISPSEEDSDSADQLNPSQDERSQRQELLESIPDIISSLFKTSIMVRNATPRDRYTKAATSMERFNDQFDIAHVAEKFPKTQKWLQERLGRAITQRRQYLRYCMEHRNALRKELVFKESDNTDKRKDPAPAVTEFQSQTHHHSLINRSEPGNTNPMTAASTLIVSQLIPLDDTSDGMTQTSYATSVADDDDGGKLCVIPISDASKGDSPFECPYCWSIQNIKTQRAWKKHVFKDLRPYVCTFERCDVKMFTARNLWFNHELQCHRTEWCCQLCSRKLSSPDEFKSHLSFRHAQNLSSTQFPALVKASEQAVDCIAASSCPFCDEWDRRLAKVNPDLTEVFVTPSQFKSHVAKHMEQLALFAIPRGFVEGEEAGSSAAAVIVGEQDMEANSEIPFHLSETHSTKSLDKDPPLHIAAFEGNSTKVKELLSNGEDVNSLGVTWKSALRAATLQGNSEMVLLLLEHGAEDDPVDLLDIAKDKGYKTLLQKLSNFFEGKAKGFSGRLQEESITRQDSLNLIDESSNSDSSDSDSNPELEQSRSRPPGGSDSRLNRYRNALLHIVDGDPSKNLIELARQKGSPAAGTCKWIFGKAAYREWLTSKTGLLWLSGKSGMGKTMVAIQVADQIEQHVLDKPRFKSVILHSFGGRTATLILWSLILQLITLEPSLLKHLLPESAVRLVALESSLRVYSFDLVWRIFSNMIFDNPFQDVYCILDGLEMCTEQSLADLLNKLPQVLTDSTRLKILVASRENIPSITRALSSYPNIRMNPYYEHQLANDLRVYAALRIEQHADFHTFTINLQSSIKEAILKRDKESFVDIDSDIQECFEFMKDKIGEDATLALSSFVVSSAGRDKPTIPEHPGFSTTEAFKAFHHMKIVAEKLHWWCKKADPVSLTVPGAASSIESSIQELVDEIEGMEPQNGLKIRQYKDELIPLLITSTRDLEDVQKFIQSKSQYNDTSKTTWRTGIAEKLELNNDLLRKFNKKWKWIAEKHPAPHLTNQWQAFAALRTACIRGELTTVERLLQRADTTAVVNDTDEDGNTPLHLSASLSLEMIATTLCDHMTSHGMGLINHRGETALHLACERGLVSLVDSLLDHGVVLKKLEDMKTPSLPPLCLACKHGRWLIASKLLARGANASVQEPDGTTPLHSAALLGSEETVRQLLDAGAGHECTDSQGQTPLLLAGRNNHSRIVEILQEHGASYSNALILAAKKGNTTAVSWILGLGVSSNSANEDGTTALEFAAANGDTAMMEVLINRGADVNLVRNNRLAALHVAILEGSASAVEFLISAGADINLRARGGQTALHIAAQEGHLYAITSLIDHGADVDARDDAGRTPLHNAIHSPSATSLLVDHGANVNCETNQRETPLQLAAGRGSVAVLKTLLAKGAVIDDGGHRSYSRPQSGDSDQRAALHYASINGKLDTVEYLLDNGSEINIQDGRGQTALHLASAQGHIDVLRLLLKRRANTSISNKDERTALHEASKNGHVALVAALLAYGALIFIKDHKGKTPLHLAAQKGHIDVVDELLAHAKFLRDSFELITGTGDKKGRTPLHHAARKGRTEIAEKLLDENVTMSLQDHKGMTPLHLAARKGHAELVGPLLRKMSEMDILMLNRNNDSARDLAERKGHSGIVELIDEVVSEKRLSVDVTGCDQLPTAPSTDVEMRGTQWRN